MYVSYKNLNSFLSQELQPLKCNDDTKAYIVSVFTKFKSSDHDYSKDSLTILYTEAKFRQDFLTFDSIGSWIFFCNTLFPEHLNNASTEYYYAIAQSSYHSCYLLLRKKWRLYEELADNFITLSEHSRNILIGKELY